MSYTARQVKDYPVNDPVTVFLRDRGFEVSAYYMGNTSLLLGARFELNGFEIVYRVDDDKLIIVIYQRITAAASGLKNGFAPFLWFAERLAYDIPEIRFLRGNPEALSTFSDKGLSTAKLLRFYSHLMGGEPDEELGWYCFDLLNYQTMRRRWRKKREKS